MTRKSAPGIEIAPLAWLLGHWRGWGIFSGAGVDAQVLIHDFHVTHDGGPYLITTSTFEVATAIDGTIAADADAATGLSQLESAGVWGTETLYLRLPPDAVGTPGPHDVEGMLADPAGFTAALAGRISEDALLLQSTALAATASAPPVTELQRRYLKQGEDLMWSASMAAFGQDLAPYVTVRLTQSSEGE
ncbi:hypothetical protein BSZ39_04985 [Bowdeniella nasicola]|uniref:THAP4-like heme-binding domain-containing protein n=1 Tax=Bowdeniella nasicola TaxID=208480 RepID=A0A1Q5Q379_9ACTO|nr:heme-binding beta-barrel domain-containing protein [Bowdeniella nasicola]OKL54257.1 hypothetical protein BSZ39_04985 [Bowdeniella nasicola]